MKVKLSKEFIAHYKAAGVRIRHEVDRKLRIFAKNPMDLELGNHTLRDEFIGSRSIDITSDWRAIYEEINDEYNEQFAYFTTLGTHTQLYKKK